MVEETGEGGWRADCAGGTTMISARPVVMSGKMSVPHVQTGLAEAPTKITLVRANMSNVFFVGCCLLIGDHAALSHVLEFRLMFSTASMIGILSELRTTQAQILLQRKPTTQIRLPRQHFKRIFRRLLSVHWRSCSIVACSRIKTKYSR